MPIMAFPGLTEGAFRQKARAFNDGAIFRFALIKDGPDLCSPTFNLVRGELFTFSLKLSVEGRGCVRFGLAAGSNGRRIHSRFFECQSGEETFSLAFRPETSGEYRLLLDLPGEKSEPVVIVEPRIDARHVTPETAATSTPLRPAPLATIGPKLEIDTYLAHWGPFRRLIHRLCKQSRALNNLVSALEMRLDREEILSLPQYMALCPTGQCNAQCEFCSVTINRTGILKKQLPFDRLHAFLKPVQKTIKMYGIEGNGEPTLYHQFADLVDLMTAGGAQAYLITNGSQIKPDDIPLMLALESVNFSLNAHDADTHRRVMKLKNFPDVIAAIKGVVDQRGYIDLDAKTTSPRVSVSYVATNDNIAEVQEFLRFCEYDLGVDLILVRPLSELGNDGGSVEDLRAIVPFESDVKDMLDAAAEYLADVPRKAEVRIVPEIFKSYRTDPFDRIVRPRGFEGRFLVPRRRDWIARSTGFDVAWNLNVATLTWSGEGPAGWLWQSKDVPVMPGEALEFRCEVERYDDGALRLAILDEANRPIIEKVLAGSDRLSDVSLNFHTGRSRCCSLAVSGVDGRLSAKIDFGRLRSLSEPRSERFAPPRAARWEICLPSVQAAWSGDRVQLAWTGIGGPYLLKSYSIPCRIGVKIAFGVILQVTRGTVGIGVLNEGFDSWLSTSSFVPGRRDAIIEFETGVNSHVQIVVYAAEHGAIEASIEWTCEEATQPVSAASIAPKETSHPAASAGAAPAAGVQLSASRKPVDARAAAQPKMPTLEAAPMVPGSSGQEKSKPSRFYCQKPWTDLHNFTVDGRMDVCCIATGASQQRYQLGNLNSQTFQEVWNGERAKEFRRTVNSGNPLPPCARCPMAHAYQGTWFDPVHTEGVIIDRIAKFRSKWVPGSKTAVSGVQRLARTLLDRVVFKGFERKSRR